MNDIFVLYKQVGSSKLVDTFRKVITDKFTDYIIRDYDDSLPDESCYESTRSFVLLCIIDDEWFYDPQCRTIWKYFWEKQINYDQQILFPVLIENIKIDNFDDTKKLIYYDAEKLGFYRVTANGSTDVDELYGQIIASLKKIEADGDYTYDRSYSHADRRKRNVHEICDIDCSYENPESWINRIDTCNRELESESRINQMTIVIQDLKIFLEEKLAAITDDQRLYPERERVCVIYTGGTAGMIFDPFETDSLELKQANLSELTIKLPRLKREKFEIDFYSFEPALDSSNIGSEHWLLIGSVIEILSKYYQGFVIIHGTNTMAYSASAISFLFDDTANKPIIFTGSEIALTERNSDAEQNIHRAIEIAAQKDTTDVQGVCILFGKWLLQGNRTTKQIALDKAEGFYSPNYPEIASVTSDKVIVDLAHIKKNKTTTALRMNKFISSYPKIAICDIYPDMDMEAFKTNCTSKDVEAVILRTYGTGGVPDKNEKFRKCIEELQHRNTIVINLTQCPKGTSEFRLFETNEMLFNYGVISGGDMVTEAAYCKLKHLFSKFNAVKVYEDKMRFIRHYMMVSIQGEMSKSIFIIPVSVKDTGSVIDESGKEYHLNAEWSANPAINHVPGQNLTGDTFAMLDPNKDSIDSAVLRLGKVRLLTNSERTRDINVKILVSIFTDDEDIMPTAENNIIHKIRFSNATAVEQDINIDILELAKKHLKPSEGVTVLLRTESRKVQIESMKILLSAIRY